MSSSAADLDPGFSSHDRLPPSSRPGQPFANLVRQLSFPSGRSRRVGDMASANPLLEGSEGGSSQHSSRQQYPEAETAVAASTPTPTRLPKAGLARHLSSLSFALKRHEAQHDTGIRHSEAMEDEDLTLFQRYFSRPIDKDPEKFYKSNNRRFSFLSIGFLFAAGIMLLLLLGVIAAAVAVTVDRKHSASHSGYQGPAPPLPPQNTSSPIRSAISDNFPDPALWYDNGTWYAYATNNAAGILEQPKNTTVRDYGASNVQLATSTDFVTWHLQTQIHDPLPQVGDWVPQGLTVQPPKIPRANVWAPSVIQRSTDNKFVMYYSANRDNATNPVPHHPPPHCIGAAISDNESAAGPYTPMNNTLACPIDQGGAIDPAAFRDKDGTLYVVYKVDGNNIGNGGTCGNTKAPIVPTPLMLLKLEADGVTPSGNATQILDRNNSDGPLIEAPALVMSQDGIYFLFFSSGCTRSPTYDIKYATAKSVHGPYHRAGTPLLESGDWGLLAPGSVGLHEDGQGGFNMAFHARVDLPQGKVRAMFTTKIQFSGHTATMVRDNSTAMVM